MNNVALVGRLARDPETKYTTSNLAVCNFTVAVDRRFKKDGEQTADFINCIAWRQTAEFVSKYFSKGQRIGLVGSIQTSSWEAEDGSRKYKTEVLVDNVEFVESKKQSNEHSNSDLGEYQNSPDGGFFMIDDETDSDIPF